jgi:hypothetical protein
MGLDTLLLLSLSGPDPLALAHGLADLGWWPEGALTLEVDFKSRDAQGKDLAGALKPGRRVKAVTDEGHALEVDPAGLVTLRRPGTHVDRGLLKSLGALPFELAVVGPLHAEWLDIDPPQWSFGDGHVPHGWTSGFKGGGYRRLVSRRWLAHGPWRLHEIDGASWVEFHALDAEPMAALKEALPRWPRLGISDEGGFIQTGFVFTEDVGGVYDPGERKLKVIVRGGDVSPRRMLEVAALRGHPGVPAAQAVERTAFVFLNLDDARRHLRELWLREHECWAIIDGIEVRMDGTALPD